MAGLNEINAHFQIVTPMFVGDAEQHAESVRPPSVKGALRFWWRALHWSRHIKGANGNQKRALQTLHAEEAKLFGSAAKMKNGAQVGGQGAYLLRVTAPNLERVQPNFGRNSGRSYIGFGLFAMGGNQDRDAIPANHSFNVRLIERPGANLHEQEREGARDALRAWGMFGGLGARARRAFGSIALRKLDGAPVAYEQVSDYLDDARRLIELYGTTDCTPPYTAFSAEARCELFAQSDRSADDAHEWIGKKYSAARHHQEGFIEGNDKCALGLPLARHETILRRASPVFMHIHPVANGFSATALYLPAYFHPQKKLSLEPVERFMDGASERAPIKP